MVDRSGTYRLNLPFDTTSGSTYAIYKNEIATTYNAGEPATPTTEDAGLHLRNFTASRRRRRSPRHIAELSKTVPLPGP